MYTMMAMKMDTQPNTMRPVTPQKPRTLASSMLRMFMPERGDGRREGECVRGAAQREIRRGRQ